MQLLNLNPMMMPDLLPDSSYSAAGQGLAGIYWGCSKLHLTVRQRWSQTLPFATLPSDSAVLVQSNSATQLGVADGGERQSGERERAKQEQEQARQSERAREREREEREK